MEGQLETTDKYDPKEIEVMFNQNELDYEERGTHHVQNTPKEHETRNCVEVLILEKVSIDCEEYQRQKHTTSDIRLIVIYSVEKHDFLRDSTLNYGCCCV